MFTWLTVRCKWMVDVCSQWTLTISAPALIKSGTRCSGSTIICDRNKKSPHSEGVNQGWKYSTQKPRTWRASKTVPDVHPMEDQSLDAEHQQPKVQLWYLAQSARPWHRHESSRILPPPQLLPSNCKQHGKMNTKYLPIDIKKMHSSAYSIVLFIVTEVGKKLLMSWRNRNTLCEAKFADAKNMTLLSYSFNSSLSA